MLPRTRFLVFSAVPHVDESFIGYLIRLTEVNHYETPAWILQLASLNSYLRKVSIAFDETLNLKGLAGLTGINEEQLRALLYLPSDVKRNKFADYDVLGSPVPRIAIRAHRPKICSACLVEQCYVRKVWDLTAVTTCPTHRCLLLDECPACQRILPLSRRSISSCSCGYDWREHPITPAEETQLEISRRVHLMCCLPTGEGVTQLQSSPLAALKLKDLFPALFFIASQYDAKGKRKNIAKFGSSLKNAAVHDLLCKAISVFHNWPDNYFSFLDWRRIASNPTTRPGGVRKDFGGYKYALYDYLAGRPFDFLRHGFEQYLITKWDGGYISNLSRLGKKPNASKKFTSKREVKRLLNVSTEKVDQLLQAGKLTGVIKPKGNTRVMLIETTSIHKLKCERNDILSPGQASKLLGINGKQISALVKCGLLKANSAAISPRRAGLSAIEIKELLERLQNTVSKCECRSSDKKVEFIRATLIGIRGIEFGAFVNDLLEGKIRSCDMDRNLGMSGVRFCRSSIEDYSKAFIQKRFPDAATIRDAANFLKTDKNTVLLLVKNAFLTAHRQPTRQILIAKKNLLAFSQKYVFGSALASELRTSTEYLLHTLRSEGLDPISACHTNGRRRYLYLRKTIGNTDLRALVENKKRAARIANKEPTQFPIEYAVKYLNASDESIKQLCSNGFLKSTRIGEYSFSRRQLRKVKGKVKKYADLVTLEVGARLLGRTPTNFVAKYVHSSLLNPVRFVDNGRCYFRRNDLERLIESQKSLLNSGHVRRILGISSSQLFRMATTGVLKPISGPLIDGATFNVFKLSDVEQLHEKRERFKGERLEIGGSNRFGSPAGPRTHPVLDKISSRVERILSESKVNATRRSGLSIHRQLLKEGFKVNINALYDCLHRLAW